MLDPDVLAHLEATAAIDVSDDLDPAERRSAGSRAIDGIFTRFGLEGPPVGRIVDHRVPVQGGAILVRSYHPDGTAEAPAHVYLHGGGWTGGSVDELVADATARHRTVAARCVTFLVDYRLAPEFRFPTAVHDVVAAVRWVRDLAPTLGVDSRTITLGGASAGANLAAAAVLADTQLGLRALVLEVPALDLHDAGELEIPADIDADDAAWLEPMRRDFRSAVADYLPDRDAGMSPLASPLLAPDVSMFPETFLLTAELDVLRPGAEHFAARLEEAGVATHLACYTGALHGSPILNATWATARRWHDDVLAILRRVNGRDPHEAT